MMIRLKPCFKSIKKCDEFRHMSQKEMGRFSIGLGVTAFTKILKSTVQIILFANSEKNKGYIESKNLKDVLLVNTF
ncbi:hypothetical protein BACAU_2953 [Bacillus velezensis CAU B946]|nr:hypothetical protein BACAU_2953 [Bacillus velezensis CAU B946]